jgi:RND family efflux transporter MFP subunit
MSAARQIILSLIVVLIAAAGWFAYDHGYSLRAGGDPAGATRVGAGRAPSGPGNAVLVVTTPVTTDDTGIDVRAIGTVAAVQEVTLYPQDSGIVVDRAFTPGSAVAKGQVLVRLDDSDQQVALDKAKIALETAQSALDRAQQLSKTNNITTVALTDALTAQKNAEIGLKQAENDLSKRTIRAPFAGTIGLTDVAVGDLISSSKAIVTLDDMSKVRVRFDVPERATGLVAIGQPVTATTEALAGRTFKGMTSAVDNRVDPVARTLKVEATLPNDANVLKPGMALTVVMSFPGTPHPSVPSLAVQWDRTGAYVWKVADGSAHRVDVHILGRRSGAVIVSGDLAENDPVVVEGLQRVREGGKVTEADANPVSDRGNDAAEAATDASRGPESSGHATRSPSG